MTLCSAAISILLAVMGDLWRRATTGVILALILIKGIFLQRCSTSTFVIKTAAPVARPKYRTLFRPCLAAFPDSQAVDLVAVPSNHPASLSCHCLSLCAAIPKPKTEVSINSLPGRSPRLCAPDSSGGSQLPNNIVINIQVDRYHLRFRNTKLGIDSTELLSSLSDWPRLLESSKEKVSPLSRITTRLSFIVLRSSMLLGSLVRRGLTFA